MIATDFPRSPVRRHPSRLALVLFGFSLVLLLLVSVAGLVAYVWPEGERLASLGVVDDYAVGVPVAFWVSEREVFTTAPPDWEFRGYLVRQPDGTPLALEARDPLEGCSVVWVAQDGFFFDPCHLNNYWSDGRAVDPKSAASLRRFALTISADGNIEIDAGGGPR